MQIACGRCKRLTPYLEGKSRWTPGGVTVENPVNVGGMLYPLPAGWTDGKMVLCDQCSRGDDDAERSR